jgi:hypothetical protein
MSAPPSMPCSERRTDQRPFIPTTASNLPSLAID